MFSDIYFDSFISGFIFCMVCDVIFSISNFFVQKAFYFRHLKRSGAAGCSSGRSE